MGVAQKRRFAFLSEKVDGPIESRSTRIIDPVEN